MIFTLKGQKEVRSVGLTMFNPGVVILQSNDKWQAKRYKGAVFGISKTKIGKVLQMVLNNW